MNKIRKSAVLPFIVVLAISAFASDKSTKSTLNLKLDHKFIVGGTALAPGDYKIVLERNGDQVQATFISNGKTVTSKTGHFESRSLLPDGDSVTSNTNDGSISEIDSKKLKGGIVFDQGGSDSAGSN